MGQDTTIALLTQMNGTLKGILNTISPKNGDDVNRTITDRVHRGNTFQPEQSAPQPHVSLNGNISIDDVIKSISSLPSAVKAIAKLHNKEITDFTDVLVKIGDSIKDFSDITQDITDFKSLDTLSKSLSLLSETKFKGTLKEFVVIDKIHAIDSMLRVTKGLDKVSKAASKINVKDLQKLREVNSGLNAMKALTTSMLTVVGSVVTLAAAIKFLDGDGGNNVLKSVGVVGLIMTGLTAIALGVGVLSKAIKPVSMTPITMFILSMQGLVLTTLLLGKVAEVAWPDILVGLGATVGIVLSYVAVAAVTQLVSKEAIASAPSAGTILGYAAVTTGLILGTLLVGTIAQTAYPEIIAGFTAIAGTILGYGTVVGATSKIAALEKTTIKNMAGVMAIAYAASGLIAISIELGKKIIDSPVDTLVGITATAAIMTGYSFLISSISNSRYFNVAEMNRATRTIGQVGLIGLEALALVGGAVLLSNYIADANPLAVAATIGLTAGMMFAIAGVAKIANKLEKDVKKGIKSLIPLELLAAGSLGLVLAATKVAEKADEVGMANVTAIVLEGMGMVAAFGALAYAAGKISPTTILKGSGVIALLELLAFGMTKILGEMTKVTAQVRDLGTEPWKEMLKTLGGMTAVVGAFGGLAALCGLGPVPAILALGAAALGTVELVAIGAVSVIKKTLEASKMIEGDVNAKIDSVTNSFSYVVESLYGMLGVKFALHMAAVTAAAPMMMAIAGSMFTISSTLSQIALVAGKDGQLRPAKFLDDGRVAYGEYADIKAATVTITDSMTYFVDELYDTFSKLKLSDLIKTAIGMKVLGMVMDPVSKFADTMLSFQQGSSEGTIHSVTFDSDGNIKYGPDVDVATVAKTIGNSISIFTKELFSTENMELWSNMISGSSFVITHSGFLGLHTDVKAMPGTAQQAMGILSMVLEPVSNFAKTLSMFSNADGNTLSIPVYSSDGKLVSTRTIDVVNAAKAISSAITSFVSGITANASTWYNLLYGAGTTTTGKGKNAVAASNMEASIGIFASLVTPVVTFTDLVSKFVTKDGKLLALNANGETHEVDLLDTSTRISSTIDSFVRAISNTFSTNKDAIDVISTNADSIQNVLSTVPSMFTNLVKDVDVNSMEILGKSITLFATNLDSVFKTINGLDTNVNGIYTSTMANIPPVNAIYTKTSENAKELSASLLKFKKAVEDVDEVLERGQSTRLKNLDDINERYVSMGENVRKLGENLNIVKGLMDELKGYSQADFETVANIISSVKVEGLLTREDVIAAIRQTLDDATITSQGRGYVLDLE